MPYVDKEISWKILLIEYRFLNLLKTWITVIPRYLTGYETWCEKQIKQILSVTFGESVLSYLIQIHLKLP